MLVIHRILCPVDLSEPSERALEYALGLAERLGAEVDVVHVFQFPTFAVEDGAVALPAFLQENLAQRLRERLEQFVLEKAGEGSKTTVQVLEGVPYVEIMEGRQRAGSHRHGHPWAHRAVAPVVGECGGAGGARFRDPGADYPLGGLALMPDGTRPPCARDGFFSQTLME